MVSGERAHAACNTPPEARAVGSAEQSERCRRTAARASPPPTTATPRPVPRHAGKRCQANGAARPAAAQPQRAGRRRPPLRCPPGLTRCARHRVWQRAAAGRPPTAQGEGQKKEAAAAWRAPCVSRREGGRRGRQQEEGCRPASRKQAGAGGKGRQRGEDARRGCSEKWPSDGVARATWGVGQQWPGRSSAAGPPAAAARSVPAEPKLERHRVAPRHARACEAGGGRTSHRACRRRAGSRGVRRPPAKTQSVAVCGGWADAGKQSFSRDGWRRRVARGMRPLARGARGG
jgi:hypothetical protein